MKMKNQIKPCGSIVSIPCEQIKSRVHDIRKITDDDFSALNVSVLNNGIIQPILVRKNDESNFEIISGYRRLIAAENVGLNYVPCIIVSSDDYNAFIYSLTENIQREDLNYFDIADALFTLIDRFNIKQSDLGKRLGKSQSWISNKLRLMVLPENIRKIIYENNLSERHARALLKIKDYDKLKKALYHIIEKKLSVVESEKYINKLLFPVKHKQKNKIVKIKDIKIFINTINHAVDTMRKAGINADSKKTETDEYFEYVVRIPKVTSSPVNKK